MTSPARLARSASFGLGCDCAPTGAPSTTRTALKREKRCHMTLPSGGGGTRGITATPYRASAAAPYHLLQPATGTRYDGQDRGETPLPPQDLRRARGREAAGGSPHHARRSGATPAGGLRPPPQSASTPAAGRPDERPKT